MDRNTNIIEIRKRSPLDENRSDIDKLLSIRNLVLQLDDATSRTRMLRALSDCFKKEAINGINH